jgi:hypothetical protein
MTKNAMTIVNISITLSDANGPNVVTLFRVVNWGKILFGELNGQRELFGE